MRTASASLIGALLVAASVAAAEAPSDRAERAKPLPQGAEGTLLIADFNSWEEINNIGGLFAGWTRDPNDPTQGCRVEITDDDHWGSSGLSIRLSYDVESPVIAFNGMWMLLQQVDLTPYRFLVIHVKGDREAGFTPRFKIEIKNKLREAGRFVITGVTDEWQEFVIPLTNFKGIRNFKVMKELTVVFDDMRCSPKIGELYIDEIYLSK